MRHTRRLVVLLAILALMVGALAPTLAAKKGPPDDKPGGGHEESYGNNLSYPVIWSEGVAKVLRGEPGMEPLLDGAWWYWWGLSGTDPNVVPLSCAPDPDDPAFCDDEMAGTTGVAPGDGVSPVSKAYLQQDPSNVWQAESADWSASPVAVSWLDWGDNLESVDWYTRSQVRTEVVLIQDLSIPMMGYEMLHTSGWGITEMHGLAEVDGAVASYPGTQATVYSPCARLVIQRLLVDRDDPALESLTWDVPTGQWIGEGLVNAPIFNKVVWEAGDGPGYYSAEINVKGKVIFGYTWNVRKLNDGAGDYRITFNLDEGCPAGLNTFFTDEFGNPVTEIVQPLEEAVAAESDEGGDTGGGVGIMDYENNLTFIDIRILERGGGGGGGRR